MFGTRTVARSLLASIFIVGGASAFRKSSQLAPAVEGVVNPIAGALGLGDVPTEKLVQANAGVQIAGGALLALGIAARPAAIALGVSLIPTTIAGYPFWKESDPQVKEQQQLGFLKNAGLLGGLIFAALDTGGRPSVFWSGRKAASNAASAVSSAANQAYSSVAT